MGHRFQSFNWATRSHAWKPDEKAFIKNEIVPFNWATRSHAWKLPVRPKFQRPIDRLQLGHAFSRVETRHSEDGIYFPDLPSIGPRVLTRGNELAAVSLGARKISLQLGHAFSRVETLLSCSCKYTRSLSSIGPRVLTRGNPSIVFRIDGSMLSSIGPRVLTRGNP